MIFAVFDVLLAVNMCINYSFLQLYLQFYYSRKFLFNNYHCKNNDNHKQVTVILALLSPEADTHHFTIRCHSTLAWHSHINVHRTNHRCGHL